MSVTFFAVGCPCEMQEVDYGDGDKVMEEFPLIAEVNMSNMNAAAICRVLGLPLSSEHGFCGELEVAELDLIVRRALMVMNGSDVSQEVRDGGVIEGDMQVWKQANGVDMIARSATVFESSLDSDGIRVRVGRMLTLLTQARQGGFKVAWS